MSSITDTVKKRHSKKAKYVNTTVPMEKDKTATASSSGTSQGNEQLIGRQNMEITPSTETMPERSIVPSNEETTITETVNNNINENKGNEERNKVNTNESTSNTGFIILRKDKGKDKETDTLETEEQTTEIDMENEDTISIGSNETNLSENEKWRIESNAKRYKAWIKIHTIKGKNLKEKTTYLLDEIKKNEIQWINLSREKNPSEKGIHLSLTFDHEEELQKILKLNLETTEEKKTTRMTRAPITRKNKFNSTNAVVKFWDVPIKTNRQDFLRIIENKFEKIKSNSARLNKLYILFGLNSNHKESQKKS
ncbi:hypothetical protein Glove_367g19 [Diversispora epigaea]|uniref:Uncharacterized protein n=1 Tax=Diversispora epigaea TaxID=1348612 RepID=A0A397HAB2_9GLOM|nr:hypothetical protein Glove_367g19 [Diversispora epigaea]